MRWFWCGCSTPTSFPQPFCFIFCLFIMFHYLLPHSLSFQLHHVNHLMTFRQDRWGPWGGAVGACFVRHWGSSHDCHCCMAFALVAPQVSLIVPTVLGRLPFACWQCVLLTYSHRSITMLTSFFDAHIRHCYNHNICLCYPILFVWMISLTLLSQYKKDDYLQVCVAKSSLLDACMHRATSCSRIIPLQAHVVPHRASTTSPWCAPI